MGETIETLGMRHGFSREAVSVLADALRRGGGTQAQFSHPELGGMGQWSKGGMIMIGAMNDHGLKARVAALAQDLSGQDLGNATAPDDRGDRGDRDGREPPHASWWPSDLGRASSTGEQNGVRYAVFPDTRRLAIERDGRTTVYDTGDHEIVGAAQSQGHDTRLRLSSRNGNLDIESLPVVR
ncbi:hypothetical protein [Aureimonas jatrophae]|uniref:SHOCT domain-containing protein n=1 Tax=Aureimonas jatrophae TaxID=1166073 RepID=A0A1H0JHT9_9HYPH|nr:hypothetical protein [Aureimonas jatrophae]MBB3951402.1 hypothetical protein [Aureimonas jatrophae]SDO43276.1 hypothetical protein SAMN05192530_106193 [Aureimonas jatrophae]